MNKVELKKYMESCQTVKHQLGVLNDTLAHSNNTNCDLAKEHYEIAKSKYDQAYSHYNHDPGFWRKQIESLLQRARNHIELAHEALDGGAGLESARPGDELPSANQTQLLSDSVAQAPERASKTQILREPGGIGAVLRRLFRT